MLVLTRKSEQKIYIGNNIVITILRVYGDQVSVGIEAPQEMRIFREELVKEPTAHADQSLPSKLATVDLNAVEKKGRTRYRKSAQWRMAKPVPAEEVL